MAKRVAFCLVENHAGEVLLIQRGYGKEKFKWSLPGGNCDGQERYDQAARREMREETGLLVETESLIFEGHSHPIKTYFGKVVGGHLKAKRPECLDAKFFAYNRLPPLAFSADQRAIKDWQNMKSTHALLASNPQMPPCSNCGSTNTRLRHYPHHNPYRCRSCNKVFSAPGPIPNPTNGKSNMVNAKETAISKIVIDHVLSQRDKLGLPEAAPNSNLAESAGETAKWLAGEEDYEDKILKYLRKRFVEKSGDVNLNWFLRLTYYRRVWPADAEPATIAEDVIEKSGLSEIINFPALDYLGIGSCVGVMDDSGNPVRVSGRQPDAFGYSFVAAYATDGNGMIVDYINEARRKVGADPLRTSITLRKMARKFITMSSTDEAGESLFDEAQTVGYLTEGWRARLDYRGSYAKFPSSAETPVSEPAAADIIGGQLVKHSPTLLRPDWQDIGIATRLTNHPELGGMNFQTEFVIGWRIPFDAERPVHFPPPIHQEGESSTAAETSIQPSREDEAEALLGPVYRESPPEQPLRRGWWPFRS